jgi:uncharacterized membrane protein
MTRHAEALARLERNLGRVLTGGVAASAVLLAAGLVSLSAAPGSPWAGHLLASGLIILMATPMCRVVLSMVEYVRMAEWFFVSTTVVVFIELAAGVVYALRR